MSPRRQKRTRGQAIVLMAFTAAFLAFTVLTTLAIGRAVRERVQLQNAADASAYSLAVQEARAFNFYAYTNRAVISHFVAMMAVYGHMSYLAYYEGVLQDLANHWGCDKGNDWFTSIPAQLVYEWAAWCVICAIPFGEWACPMCEGDSECVPEEMDYITNNICQNVDQKLTDVDQDLGKSGGSSTCFADLTKVAKQHREGLVSGGSIGGFTLGTGFSAQLTNEESLVDANMQLAFVDQSMTKQIAQSFDKSYGVGKNTAAATLVGAMNVVGIPGDSNKAGYCKAGVTSDGPVTSTSCKLVGGSDVTSLSTQQQAANASRLGPASLGGSDWLNNRPDGIVSTINAYIIAELVTPGERDSALTGGTGMSREVTDPKGNAVSTVQNNAQGGYNGSSGGGGSRGFAGEDHGNLFSIDLACIMNITLGIGDSSPQTYAYSEPKGAGTAEIGWADGSTSDSDDYDIGGCNGGNTSQCGVGWPTINFNPSSSSDALFNQPHTWAFVTKSFKDSNLTQAINSQTYDTQNEGPFAMKRTMSLDGTNKYTYNNGITLQSGDPDYSPGREAMYALAQGLTYYHRPGNWQEPPNFYNPYWRAKLQPVQMANSGNKGVADAKIDIAAILIAGGYPAAEAAEIALLPVTE